MSLSVPWVGGPEATLDLRGNRGALTGEAAKALLAERLAACGGAGAPERAVLSTWAFSEDAAREVAAALAAMPRLRSAVLSDMIAGRPEAEGLAVYRALCAALTAPPGAAEGGGGAACERLEELDLSDNAVGTKGVEAWRPLLLALPRLRRLFFCNCGISAEAARAIADCLAPGGRETALRVLHFDNNMSGGAGAAAVGDIAAASPQLEDLRFTSSRGDRAGVDALCRGVGAARALRRLDLPDTIFAEPLGAALGAALAAGRLAQLTFLDLGDTLLRDAGVAALASGLVRGCASSLEHLDLSVNEVTPEGARAVGRCVRRLARLRVLLLHENELEDEGALCVARALRRRREGRRRVAKTAGVSCDDGDDPLEVLDLSENMLTDASVGALARASAAAGLARLTRLGVARNDELTRKGLARARAALAAGGLGAASLGEIDEDELEEGGEGGDGGGGADEAAGDDDADSETDNGAADALADALAAAKV